jgi:hypothetical protein
LFPLASLDGVLRSRTAGRTIVVLRAHSIANGAERQGETIVSIKAQARKDVTSLIAFRL